MPGGLRRPGLGGCSHGAGPGFSSRPGPAQNPGRGGPWGRAEGHPTGPSPPTPQDAASSPTLVQMREQARPGAAGSGRAGGTWGSAPSPPGQAASWKDPMGPAGQVGRGRMKGGGRVLDSCCGPPADRGGARMPKTLTQAEGEQDLRERQQRALGPRAPPGTGPWAPGPVQPVSCDLRWLRGSPF